MSAPFGNTKYSEFDPGDSGLVGTSLLKAGNQLFTKYIDGIIAFNAANGANPLPIGDANNDSDTSLRTNSFIILARKEWNVTTKKYELIFSENIEPYVNWTTPTTGNLEGMTTLSEACYAVAVAIKKAYDLLQPNAFVADPSGLASVTDSLDGSIPVSVQYLMISKIDPVTGDTVFAVNDLLTILDSQQGV